MTIRASVARQVREARERLRDLAAADHAVAENANRAASEQVASEKARLALVLDDAPAALEAATSVYDLERVALVVDDQEDAVVSAEKDRAVAADRARLSAAQLRERTRLLRSAEKVVELVEKSRATAEARAEQRTADDLAGSRR
jgi:hypothetical protein